MNRSFVGAKAVGTRKRTRSGNLEIEVSTEQFHQETSITALVTEKSIPELRGIKSFPNVDPFIKELLSFPPKNLLLAGILSCCTENWAKLTSDSEILQTIKGCKMEFTQQPVQTSPSRKHQFSVSETKLIEKEIKDLESKGLSAGSLLFKTSS